ncbi:MAG: tRNA (adenosine(37)-N6)-dimethylallyltransferase MiaA [Succinivibrio sp.]|nr:tRNA (adenosine(37)-N6)-dimethylallyltransferase MiaA [Succinivibrio sp.]
MVKALALLGPTASGKSALALQLAGLLRVEIISLDSAQVYRGLDKGTAKPTAEERAQVPHHLIDIRDPAQLYSAADFARDCVRLAEEISDRGALPLICGGTMMYYKALTGGLSPLPSTSPKTRQAVAELAQREGWEGVHERLKDADPDSYTRLSPHDKQRLSRALEVLWDTGRPMGYYFAAGRETCPLELCECVIMPEADRRELREIIAARFVRMLRDGLVAEVEGLRARGDLNLQLPSMRCVGYRQVWEYLDGAYDYEEMVQRVIIATAQLAKHQMTWLRGSLSREAAIERLTLPMGAADNLERLHERAKLCLN